MKQKQNTNTGRREGRRITPNRITRSRVSWLLAPVPSHVRDLIDAEAEKWGIGLGEAVARFVLGKAAVVA